MHVAWSPDGTQLATDGYINGCRLMVYDIIRDATGAWVAVPKIDLTASGPLAGPDSFYGLDWANGSNKLAVAVKSAPEGHPDIWIVDLDGNPYNPQNITNTADVPERQPSWSPDDSQIVYVRDDSIYKMDAQGGSPVRLAAPGRRTVLRYPDWRH